MDKRYQVFVSSTYSDLREERKSIIEVLLNAKLIPAGMELFSASNDEQFEYIKKIIDNCDYYILVIAARYGSINSSSGKSYTELEYDYAVSKNIPIIVFLHNDPYNLPEEKREDDKRNLLDEFRRRASATRMCKMWHTQTELVGSVIVSILELVSNNPQPGWLRGGEYDNAELLSQINAIRIEKDKLEKEIDRLNSIIGKSSVIIENIAKGSESYKVYGTQRVHNGYEETYPDHNIILSWDSIFSAIGPYLISPQTYTFFESKLNSAINAAYGSDFYYINEDCTQTIKIQLCAYELIEVKTESSKKGDITEFISLTEKGKMYLFKLKSVKTMVKDTSPEQNPRM